MGVTVRGGEDDGLAWMGGTRVKKRITPDKPLSFAERARKKIRTENISKEVRYMYPSLLLPAQNICERIFSKAGYDLSDRRKGLIPSYFESQMFL